MFCNCRNPLCPSCYPCGAPQFDPRQFHDTRPDHSIVSGARGGATHEHDYDDLGIGHIQIQSTGKNYPYSRFNDRIDEMLPPWMKE